MHVLKYLASDKNIMDEMRILVTGGSGFIGSNFLRYMINKYPSCSFTNIDKLTYCGNMNNLLDVENNKNYKFVRKDVCNKKIVNEIAKDTDIIINFCGNAC